MVDFIDDLIIETSDLRVPRAGNIRYQINPFLKPVATVNPGMTITVETQSAYGSLSKSYENGKQIQPSNIKPVTGPIYINNAEPGDTLVVFIHDIRPQVDRAVAGPIPDFKGLVTPASDELDQIAKYCSVKPKDDGSFQAVLDDIELPWEPAVGVLGTTPTIKTATYSFNGSHGGDLGIREICPGNKVYLPVAVKGALLYCSDLQVCQGDGHVFGVSVVMTGETTMTVGLIKNKEISWPRIESPQYIMTVATAKSLDEAVRTAFSELVLWLTEEYGLKRLDACMLCSLVARGRLANFSVDHSTFVARFPKRLLPAL